jgi:hypothetical protein
MAGFFRSLKPFLSFGLGLAVLAILGGLAQALTRWIGVPLSVFLVPVGITAVVVAVLCVSPWRR